MSKRKHSRPVYMTCKRLIDPDTGEMIGALVPSCDLDRHLLKQRRVAIGKEYRVGVEQARNSKFHRLVHALGRLVSENVDAFSGLSCHAVIKRLQREAGVFCEEQEIEIPGIGKLVVKVAQSIAFDCMDEADFHELYSAICRHVAATYWPELDEEAVEAMAGLMPVEAA
jgi:hypothetical protein